MHALLACAFVICHVSPYNLSRVALYSGAVFDITTTVAIRNVPEANPVIGQQPVRQIAMVGGLTVISDSLSRELKKDGHPKAATIINFITGSVHFGAGIWNIKDVK